jgi:tRNA A37 threonylcarbamoyladenosine dehydratase
MTNAFDYATAFSRNIGWVTQAEQATLSHKRVALAGMGGVGGFHLMTLVRLGIQRFHIADLDHFELANWNRQAGATLSSLGQHKAQVLARMAGRSTPTARSASSPRA